MGITDKESKPYDSSLSLIRALDLKGTATEGYYAKKNGRHVILSHTGYIDINPYTVCRNSGIKDKNGNRVFEYDLLKLTHGMKESCYGFIVWDEFYKSWKIRRRTDRTAYNNIDDWAIEAVGNILLHDADADVIYRQEKAEDAEETFIDTSYCSSRFKR